jgi:CBS domain containing-hemolysin-like protein
MIAPALLALAVLLAPAILMVHGRDRRAAYLRGGLHLASMGLFALSGWLLVQGDLIWERLAFVFFGLCWTGPFWVVALRNRHAGVGSLSPAVEATVDEADSEELEAEEPLEPTARLFLDRLLAISRLRVGEIATPRDRIVYADCADGLSGALTKIRQSGFLRIPMVDGSLDRIVGVVHAKDLIPAALGGRPAAPLRSLMRRTFFISRDATAASLLDLFRSQRGHLAIVVDEYSHTVGLVTRSDFFRHLSGGEGEAR